MLPPGRRVAKVLGLLAGYGHERCCDSALAGLDHRLALILRRDAGRPRPLIGLERRVGPKRRHSTPPSTKFGFKPCEVPETGRSYIDGNVSHNAMREDLFAELLDSVREGGAILRGFCELRCIGNCSGPLERHHIINRGHLRSVAKGLKYCDDHADVLIADICHAHNTSRIADTKQARAYLLQKRVDLFGAEYVSGILEGLRALCRVPPPEWSLGALLSHSSSW